MKRALPLVSVVLLACCGYSTRSLLPPHLRTFALLPVENATLQPGLGDQFEGVLNRAFTNDRSLRAATADDADLVLTTKVTSYSRTASVYDQNQNVQAYELSIAAQVDAHDQVRDESFFSEVVAQRVSYDPSAEAEDAAAARCLDLLAKEVVRRVITKW